MQAAQWALNADSVYSRSGEFVVTGADAAETAALTSAFEAEIRAELGDSFLFEEAQDNLQTKFKADGGGMGLIAAVVVIVASMFIGPAISALIGNIAGAAAGTTFAAVTTTTTAGLGNMAIGSFVTGTLSNAIGQSVATGRVDWNSALKSGAVSGFTAGLTNAPVFDGQSLNTLGGIGAVPGSDTPTVSNSATWGDRLVSAGGRAVVNAGVSSAIYGTSFSDALRNSLVNDMAAFGANDIGDGNFGEQGSVGHTLAHGVLGAMAESARGGDPLAGAIGAMTAAQLSKPLGDSLGVSQGDTGTQAAVTALTMLAGGLLAEAAGRDAEAGGAAAQNEVINNYLDHLESTEYAALEEKCGRAGSGCTAQEQARMRELNTLDKARDALLASACANPSSVACAGQLADLTAARMSFSGQDVAPGSRAASELTWIKQEQAKLEARVQSPGTYNVGTAVLEVAGGGVKATLDLATLSAQAASGDTTAQAQLSQIAEAIGEFFASPADTIEQHISTTLAEARALDDAGRTDEAQRLRATLFTEGTLAITGAGALVVKGSGKVVAFLDGRKATPSVDDLALTEAAKLENRINADNDVFAGTGQNTKGNTSPAFKGNTDLDEHLTTGGPHKGGVYGAHNETAFFQAVQEKGWTLQPDQRREIVPGIYENFYMDKRGDVLPKTTYDPKVWSDAQMQSMSRQAVVKVESDANRGTGKLPSQRNDVQATIDGVPFVVKYSKNGYYAHPGVVRQ